MRVLSDWKDTIIEVSQPSPPLLNNCARPRPRPGLRGESSDVLGLGFRVEGSGIKVPIQLTIPVP